VPDKLYILREGWKGKKLEGWKIGRMEGWKIGRMGKKFHPASQFSNHPLFLVFG
jgi:hypothetical protein